MAAFWKAICQSLLKRAGMYERLKGSCLYDAYWRVADPRIVEQRKQELAFFRKTLVGFRRNDLIFDIGANHGVKAEIFLRLGARVIAVDPDVSNQKTLSIEAVNERSAYRSQNVFSPPRAVLRTYGPC